MRTWFDWGAVSNDCTDRRLLNSSSFLEKAESTATITNTPDVLYTEDLIYAMSNTTALVNTQWVFGAAFINGTVDGWDNPLRVVDFVEEHLGDNLIGIQLSNEPDLCVMPCASLTFRSQELTSLAQVPRPAARRVLHQGNLVPGGRRVSLQRAREGARPAAAQ